MYVCLTSPFHRLNSAANRSDAPCHCSTLCSIHMNAYICFEKQRASLLFLSVHHNPSFSHPLHVPLSLTLSTVFSASYFAWFIVICVSAATGLPLCICEGVVLFMAVCAINHFSLKMMSERRYTGMKNKLPGLTFNSPAFLFQNGRWTYAFALYTHPKAPQVDYLERFTTMVQRLIRRLTSCRSWGTEYAITN